jgi:hypothetical protein
MLLAKKLSILKRRMSFFSYLTLAANRGVRTPSKEELDEVFVAAGVSKPSAFAHGGYNLHSDITDLFNDAEARQKNDRFFCPDSIGGNPGIKVSDFDGSYEGPGYSVAICGNGYFFPWRNEDLRQRVLSNPKLVNLAMLMQEAFGGSFERPKKDSKFWDRMIIEISAGWAWLGHQS